MNDRDLISACIARDPKAWECLLSRHSGLVCNVVRKTLRSFGRMGADREAEELAGEIFSSLAEDDGRALKSIGEPWNLAAWLVVTSRRRTIDFLRRRRLPTVSLDAEIRTAQGDGRILDVLSDDRPGLDPSATRPGDEDIGDGAHALLQEALNELPPRERLMTTLFYLKGKKYREIADILGIPMNSVGPTLVRTLAKLNERLKRKGVSL